MAPMSSGQALLFRSLLVVDSSASKWGAARQPTKVVALTEFAAEIIYAYLKEFAAEMSAYT